MKTPHAILIGFLLGGLLIGAAILYASRWQISAAGGGTNSNVVYKFDSWTGDIFFCPHTDKEIICEKPRYQ